MPALVHTHASPSPMPVQIDRGGPKSLRGRAASAITALSSMVDAWGDDDRVLEISRALEEQESEESSEES